MELTVGIQGHAEALVEKEDTAQVVGSGDLLVYATPCLAEGESSVGTMMNVSHTSATPVGMEVRAESTVTAVAGRKVTFEIVAYDEAGEIGRAVHERFIIKTERFLEKTYDKL